MKKIFYSLGSLVILFLIGLGIKESFFVNDTPKKDSDSNMSISVSDDSGFVDAITKAEADYETVTEIVLTSDVTLTSEINIKNGQNIRIVNQVNGVEIGQTDLGHTLTVNSTISIDRQASLSLETNTILGSSDTSNGTIMASDDNNATNLDFNAELAILDSLTINSNASLNTSMFKELDLSGSINLVGGAITGNGTLNVNKEAGIIQTSGTYEDTVKFTGEGLFVSTSDTAPSNSTLHRVTGAQIFSDEILNVSSGTYILTESEYDLGYTDPERYWDWGWHYRYSYNIDDGDLNLFSICDTKIYIGRNSSDTCCDNINVNNSHSLNIGGISSGSSFYSAGTNQIVIDGGATWETNPSGYYYFVTGAYEAGMDLAGSSVENYGRSRYSASGRTSTTPTIKVTGDGTTLNLYRGVTLQNRINTQTAETGENVGGAISLYGDSTDNRVNLNINGASIRYNALTNIDNSAGGAGIGAQNGDINFIYGDVSYNTLYNSSASNSSDGAGISLVNNSNLTMEEGSKVSYNHGNGVLDGDGGADAGGIMVREGSDLTINGGEVSYNFTYGFGGGICIYNSDVTIKNGLVYGNRSTYGGGISTSGRATVILGEEGKSSNLEVAYNTAFSRSGNNSSGFGGGLALGNSTYITNQSLIVYDGLIHNNTAVYGGGISNYSTGNSNNNKLSLNGGTISDNKASSSNQGDGIYAINTTNSGTEPLIVMSGNIQVSTSNNIVFAGLTGEYGNIEKIAISNANGGWDYWEGTGNTSQQINGFGSLVATSMNVEDDDPDYVTFFDDANKNNDDPNKNNYNGYFEITTTQNILFKFKARKTSITVGNVPSIINVSCGGELYETISVNNGSDSSYIDYYIHLNANQTYRFELATKNSDNDIQIYDLNFQKGMADEITQTPIEVSDELTANGIVGLISYEGSLYSNNAVLANYTATAGNAQVDKFIIDNTNYRIETSGTQVLIVQNTGNIIAYVNNEPFSNLTDAINYIKENNLKTATIKIINNVNLQGADFITIPTGYDITITSSDSVPYTLNIPSNITGVNNTTLFTVSSGASLTLDNIIIEGNSTQSAGYLIVENNGTFTLQSDATINNNLGIDGYASAIEIGRSKTTTNIYGSITNNIGDYGAIYLSNSEAVVNIYEGAIITGNTYTGSTDGLENITDADIFIENGTLNLNGFSGQIGTIIKQGSGSIKANNISDAKPIDIKLNGNNYVRNNVVVEVEDNEDYSSKFKLLEPQDDKAYDKLIKEDGGYNIILNMVLTIEISFEDIWQEDILQEESYNKIPDINDVDISDANFDTLEELAELKEELELSYDIDYHVGESALFFYIASTFFQLELTKLANVATRSGYYLNGFVEHALGATTSRHFYGMDSFISVQNFTDDTSHIYLGVEWLPEQYTLEFNNGGLSTANQTMTNQTIPYSAFETGLPTIKPNLYFATGFYFKGWKVRIDSDDYVIDENGVLILDNRAQITPEILNTILSQTNSNTFVLEAVWGSIFGDVNLAHVGTSSDAAFEISTKAGLEALADTVNGNNKPYDRYDYYTNIDSNGNGSFEAFSYENYYFKLTGDIGSSDDPFTNVIGQVADFDDNYFKSEEAEKPIQDPSVLADSKPFSGTLDGGSNTININIKDSNNKDFVGLFAYTKDATIANINITGSVSGRISVGSLVGLSYGGTYGEIQNDADVTFNGINAGGIFGTYYIEQSRYAEGSITNVVNRGNVSYSPINNDPSATDLAIGASWHENQILYAYQGSRAGGIVGQSWHLTLREVYNSGNISARFGVGGIVGTMISENESTRDDSVIRTAFNSGKIEATSGLLANYTYNNDEDNVIQQVNAYAGGIAGRMYGASTLTNSMNIGEVSATWTGALNNGNYEYNTENPTLGARGVGGILGVTSIDVSGGSLVGGNKTVSNVINTGKVSAWTHVGGIAGILAYSDLSYAINVAIVEATGVHYENGEAVSGGFSYTNDETNRTYHNFLGALIGLGVSANVNSTAVFDGDLLYKGYTDSIVQAIGDKNAAISIGYDANNDNSLKLASSHLICQPNDEQPVGLDSTFFKTGWIWLSYDDSTDQYYYYPQLVSFVNSDKQIIKNSTDTVSDLSKRAVTLTDSKDKPVDDTHEVTISLELGEGKIDYTSDITTSDGAIFSLKDGVWEATINYILYRGDGSDGSKKLDLTKVENYLTYKAYVFAGWYRDSRFTEAFDGVVSSNDEVLYAKWEPAQYTMTLTGMQKYANGNVELDGDNIIYYTIEDANAAREFILPTIKDNKAYRFEHWEISNAGNTYIATSVRIELNNSGSGYIVRLYKDNEEQGNFVMEELGALDFTLVCEAIDYQIDYSYLDTKDNSEITDVSNHLPSTFNINSTFDLSKLEQAGYNFINWFYNDIAYTSITQIIALGFDNLDENIPLELEARFERRKFNIILNLSNGSFNNISNNKIIIGDKTYNLTQNSQGVWQITYIEYKEDISFLWTLNNFADYIIAPAGSEFIGFSNNIEEINIEEIQKNFTTMPAGDLNIYAHYKETVYKILLIAGNLGDITLNFTNDYKEIDSSLLYENNNLYVTANYGADISDILAKVVERLVNENTIYEQQYNFNMFKASYMVADSEKTFTFSYYNIRIDEDYTVLKIEFIFTQNVYNIAIFDSLGNYIINYQTDDETISWLNEHKINISDFKNWLATSLEYQIPSGYTYDDYKFNIRINNELVYENSSQDTEILVNGYTIINLLLEPKEYIVSYVDELGNEIKDAPTSDVLIYNQQVDLSYTASKNGYNFVGWEYNGQILGQIFMPSKQDIEQDKITLKARFEEASYNVTFEFEADALWGSNLTNRYETFVYNESEVKLEDSYFNLEGYLFQKATYNGVDNVVEVTYINNAFLDSLGSERDITIVVELTIIKLEVTFDAGDGHFIFNQEDIDNLNAWYLTELGGTPITSKPTDETVLKYYVVKINYYGIASLYIPSNPIRTGFSFSNYTCNEAGIVLQSQLKENTTFNAKYVEDKYTITLINDGTITTIDNLVYGQYYNLNTGNKTGYEFDGWYNVATNEEVNLYYQVFGSVVLEACYNIKSYNLIFNDVSSDYQNTILSCLKTILNDGSLVWENGKFEIPYNTNLSSLNSLFVDNKLLVFSDDSGNYTFSNMPASDLSLSVDVKEAESIIINGIIKGFLSEDGNLDGSSEVRFVAFKHDDGYYYVDDYKELSFTGYNFANSWNVNDVLKTDLSQHEFSADDAGREIYSQVEIIDYTITFANVDDSYKPKRNAYYGETIEEYLERNGLTDPTLPGYTFVAWEYFNNDYEIYSNLTLTATYKAIDYTIAYYNESEQLIKNVSIPYGQDIGDLPTLDKEVYEYLAYVVYNSNSTLEDIFKDGVMVNLAELINDYHDAIIQDESGNYTIKIVVKKLEKTFKLNVVGSNVGHVEERTYTFTHSSEPLTISAPNIKHYNYLGLAASSINGIVIEGTTYDELIKLFNLEQNDSQIEVQVDVYYIYEPIEYSITFKDYPNLPEIRFTYEDENTYVAIPKEYILDEAGKVFNGWEINGKVYKDAFRVDDFIDYIQENNTIEAEADFTELEFTVVFYYNGQIAQIDDVLYGTTYKNLAAKLEDLALDLEREGYNFTAWVDSQGNELTEDDDTHKVTSNMAFRAIFTPITYTIRFDNGMEEQTFTYDKAQNLSINTINRNGYRFIGWATEQNGSVVYTDGQKIINLTSEANKIIDLYAVYEEIVYTINFNTDGGTNILSITYTITNLPNLDDYLTTKLGYDFVAWYQGEEEISSITESNLGDYKLIAKWEEKVYKITYENATIDGDFTSYTYGETLSLPQKDNVTSKDGYEFKGWWIGNTLIDTKEEIAKFADSDNNITLLAKWQANQYTINYQVDSKYGSLKENKVTVSYDKLVTLPNLDATTPGYTFKYWAYDGMYYTASSQVSKLTTNSEITLIAVFEFTITFNGNGGTGTVSSISGIIDSDDNISVILPGNGFTREHYRFVGWSTTNDGGTIYQPGEVYTSLAQPLYAIWEAEEYTIEYYDDSNNLLASDTYTYGEGYEVKEVPVINGYNVTGWFTEENDLFEYTLNTFGNINLHYNVEALSFETTIKLQGLKSNEALEAIKKAIETKIGDSTVQVNINENDLEIIITLTTKYGESRNILNEIFADKYEYVEDGVTYTLYPQRMNPNTPALDTEYPYQFITTSIVVNLFAVYGQFLPGSEPETNMETLGNYSVSASDLILKREDIASYIRSIYGYTWSGEWYYEDETGKHMPYVFSSPLTNSINLYAVYNANTFTINYGNNKTQTVQYDSKAKVEDNIVKPGYKFIGYAIPENGLVVLQPGDDINKVYDLMVSQELGTSITLYSIYESNVLTISFENGNQNAVGNMPNVTYLYSELLVDGSLQLPEISSSYTLIGHRFSSWKYNLGDDSYDNLETLLSALTKALEASDVTLTLEAVWEVEEYSITYIDAVVSGNNSYHYGDTMELPTPAIKEGYDFKGWYVDTNYSQKVDSITSSDYGNKIYYAKWEAKTYKIYFELTENESFVDSSNLKYDADKRLYYVEQAYGHTINYLPNVIKDNYNFNGWQYNNEVISVGNLYNYAQDIYLTANTSEKDYTITFVLNNGEASKVVTVKFGSDISQIIQENFKNDPNKEGYTFNGWSQDSGQVLNNLVITAKWEANTYTVTFNNNGESSKQSFTYDVAQNLDLNQFKKTGYRFMGWSLSENGSVEYTDGASVINLTSENDGNVNLYAVWEIVSYTIKYELDGGINSPLNPTTYTVKDNVIFENPTKEGYTFDGWYLDGNYQTPITSTNDKYDSLTLYAKWEIINYTIKYELNGGTNNQANISQYNIELGTITLYAPTKDGYNFIGWYLNNSLVKTINIDTFNENSSITLVAKFEAKEYKVTYINELANSEVIKTIKYDEILDLINGEEIAGYEFVGWYLDNVKIESGITFNYLNNITLIARYNIINYTITYELDGGTNNLSNPSTYNVENTITFANPTKTGYRFAGWTYNDKDITTTEGLTGNII